MPAQLTELKIGDVAIRLHRAGSGPKLLFLHGAGGVPQWLPFFDALADHYEVLVPEHPGFGSSDDPPWIQSMSDLAMFYLDLVEETGLDRIHLVGNSLGGWLAAEILIRDRSRFRSLTLLAPAGIRIKASRAATISSGARKRPCEISITIRPSPTGSWRYGRARPTWM
jgi:pimeloyl-ACP methyl ester carboxylesterase